MLILREDGSVIHHSALIGSKVLLRDRSDRVYTVVGAGERRPWVAWCLTPEWESFTVAVERNSIERRTFFQMHDDHGPTGTFVVLEGVIGPNKKKARVGLDEIRVLTDLEIEMAEVMTL